MADRPRRRPPRCRAAGPRDAVEDRRIVGDGPERVVLPPQQARVGALEQPAVSRRARSASPAPWRAASARNSPRRSRSGLAPRRAPRVRPIRRAMRRPRGSRAGAGRTATCGSPSAPSSSAREPPAGRRQRWLHRGPWRGRVEPRFGAAAGEPVAVAVEAADPAVIDDKRLRDHDPVRVRRHADDCRARCRVAIPEMESPPLDRVDRFAGALVHAHDGRAPPPPAAHPRPRRAATTRPRTGCSGPPATRRRAPATPRRPDRRRAGAAEIERRSAPRSGTCTSPAGRSRRTSPSRATSRRVVLRELLAERSRARRRPRADVGGSPPPRSRPTVARQRRARRARAGTSAAPPRRALARRCTAITRSS